MYNFDSLLQRRGTNCTKWDALGRDFGREDLMPFWVADMDFPVLPEIVQALRRRSSEDQTFGYTFAGKDYYESVIQWNQTRHNLHLEREDIIPIPGVVTALAVIILSLTRENDSVVINPPVYTPFFHVVENMKRKLVQSPLLHRDGTYKIDFEDLERTFRNGAKMYLMCSPHNPVGRVWTKEELERVALLCQQYGVILVSDEIHSDIVFSGHVHTPILNVDLQAVLVSAPSKTFNIAGLKSSTIMIRDPQIRTAVKNMVDAFHLYPNLFAYEATIAAYTSGGAWLDELNNYLEANANFVVDFFRAACPEIQAYVPESTYLMWLDLSRLGLTDRQLAEKVVQQAGVALNQGLDYSAEYGQYMRLNIGTPRSYLEQGLKRIAEAFQLN